MCTYYHRNSKIFFFSLFIRKLVTKFTTLPPKYSLDWSTPLLPVMKTKRFTWITSWTWFWFSKEFWLLDPRYWANKKNSSTSFYFLLHFYLTDHCFRVELSDFLAIGCTTGLYTVRFPSTRYLCPTSNRNHNLPQSLGDEKRIY